MVYILETKLSNSISVYYALQSIYGLGKNKSFLFCRQMGFASNLKILNLSEEQVLKFLKLVESSNIFLTDNLKKHNRLVIKRLIFIKSYRGLRRIKGLPVRGQRTHTNSKTAAKIVLKY